MSRRVSAVILLGQQERGNEVGDLSDKDKDKEEKTREESKAKTDIWDKKGIWNCLSAVTDSRTQDSE